MMVGPATRHPQSVKTSKKFFSVGLSLTVVLRAIEIGLRAAVGRFLISREKSGGRSVDFYAVGVWKKRVPGAVQVYSDLVIPR